MIVKKFQKRLTKKFMKKIKDVIPQNKFTNYYEHSEGVKEIKK